MKKMMFTLIALLTFAASASAMSYEQARNEALFLTDKMAYELNLTDAQYEAAYEINLDYLMGVTSQYDVFGPYWERRNLDLSYILFSWQWDMFRAATYFYRPLYWNAGYWHFGIYARYPHRDYFYFGRPHFYASYRGGHSWRMNGGRSFYEGRRDFYRPAGHNRDNHFGMRNGFDRGDYRGGRVAGGSSTRHSQGNDFGRGQQPGQNGSMNNGHDNGGGQMNNGQNRSGGTQGGFGSNRGSFGGSRSSSGSSENHVTPNNMRSTTTPQVQRSTRSEMQQRTVTPQVQQRAGVSSERMTANPQQSRSSSVGSFGGSRSSSSSSAGSVRSSAPTRSSGSSHSSGSASGGSRSNGHGNFGGSRR